MLTLSVSELNKCIKNVLEELCSFSDLYIRGEVSNFTHHYRSGHFYFTLKDEASSIRAVMFRGHASQLRFEPQNGMMVLVRGNIGVFERDGVYQLYVTDIMPEGDGAIALAVRQLRDKLDKLGWLDPARKKPLPAFPETVGVITSRSGAVLGDIVSVMTRRYPLARLLFCPALVQGEPAPASLVGALSALDGKCDVIIIARGGGSQEDLWAFQSELLAKAIVQARTPVISAVGHEGDVTICDLVADHRAPTPSAAAELAVPSAAELRDALEARRVHLYQLGTRMLSDKHRRLLALAQTPALSSPMRPVEAGRKRLDLYAKIMYNKKQIHIKEANQALARRAALLESLSPLRVLGRGYSVVSKNGSAVFESGELAPGDMVRLRFYRGDATASIVSAAPKEKDNGKKET